MPQNSYHSNRNNSRNSYSSRGNSGGGGRGRFQKRGPKKDYIHPSRFIKAAQEIEVEEYIPTHQFNDFAINELLKDNLNAKGILVPSPIQDQSIPLGLQGKNIVGIANTGTGKTIAFAIPVLNRLMNDRTSRALIVAPTRELAQQIEEECRAIARTSGLFGTLIIGGAPMGRQLADLRQNPSIVIGTPGRIKDHIERGTLDLRKFNIAVLDEVDRMLDMGFVDDMRSILSNLADDRQSFFFSATLDARVRTLINQFTEEPVVISVKTGETSDSVEQNVVHYNERMNKIDQLHEILSQTEGLKALVFDETKFGVERLSNELIARGFQADAIHGGKSQGQRIRALNKFKSNQVNILVATDVAARGIDVADVTHVINYSTPQTYDDYVHRIGRAGRAGRKGFALTFIDR